MIDTTKIDATYAAMVDAHDAYLEELGKGHAKMRANMRRTLEEVHIASEIDKDKLCALFDEFIGMREGDE